MLKRSPRKPHKRKATQTGGSSQSDRNFRATCSIQGEESLGRKRTRKQRRPRRQHPMKAKSHSQRGGPENRGVSDETVQSRWRRRGSDAGGGGRRLSAQGSSLCARHRFVWHGAFIQRTQPHVYRIRDLHPKQKRAEEKARGRELGEMS